MTFAAKPFAAAVNHLLARESWARERLVPYAGKTARLSCPPAVLTLAVGPDGYLAAADVPEGGVDVVLTVSASALSAFAQGGQAAAMKHVKIEGDAEFAATLGKLAEHLRWEPEEDLARVFGDAPAARIAALARRAGDGARRASRNLLDSLVEYLLDENPQLVRRAELDTFNTELARVRDALARTEKRIERLEQRAASGRRTAD